MYEIYKELIKDKGGKILLCVLDGIGGLRKEIDGKFVSELEYAKTENLDKLAKISSKGLHIPVAPGITPGSGPGHLGIFGYDPTKPIKRGVMEALGIGIELRKGDVAARGNFVKAKYEKSPSQDLEDIVVLDRRAGRIDTKINEKLCEEISRIKEIDGTKIKFFPVKEHRICVVFENFSEDVEDTDPQKNGEFIRKPKGKYGEIVSKLTREVFNILKDNEFAQCIVLRGFSKVPEIQPFPERWKLKSLAISQYPMYIGIAKILGMDTRKVDSLFDEINVLKNEKENYDFIYFHYKATDSAGEDGDFERKVRAIEEFDLVLPEIIEGFDVVCITGDHSTPSVMKAHSFHPVPILIYSKNAFKDGDGRFTEYDAATKGILGIINSTDIMPLLLAHAERLEKFGA